MFDSNTFDPLKFKFNNVIITSFQEYSKLTGKSLNDLTLNGKYNDGYTLPFIKHNISVIFYNEAIYKPRSRFTLFHEIGHIVLEHKCHCQANEDDADYFAAQCILPNILLKNIKKRGYSINKDNIVSIFDVSEKVAINRINYLSKYPESFPCIYDDTLLFLLQSYLDLKFKNRYFDYEQDEELEAKRNKWRSEY